MVIFIFVDTCVRAVLTGRTNPLEQFAGRCDVIKFPANLQNPKLKSHAFLASLSVLSKIVRVFVKCPKCFGIFRTINLV